MPVHGGDTPTVTEVPVSLTVVDIKAANSDRKGLIIYNDAVSTMLIKYGAGASATSFSRKPIRPHAELELGDEYRGLITGIWLGADASGEARVTEWV